MDKDQIREAYASRWDSLVSIATSISAHISSNLQGQPRIDRITARPKDPARFLDKALKIENGKLKYEEPLRQIQDQVGARVIVFYESDVDAISEALERYYRRVEARLVSPESEIEFGYVGKHYIFRLPQDVFEEGMDKLNLPEFFELQIKTLFQHAWSEANHDLGYKEEQELNSLQKRHLAFTAAQAWGADQIFTQIKGQLD